MTIVDDLRAAAAELAEQSVITQESWSAALVEGWLKSRAIGSAVVAAAGADGVKISSSLWERLVEQAGRLSPPLRPFTSMKEPLRVWIANNATLANDALWDGRIDDARRLMVRGGRRADGRAAQRRAAKAEMRKDERRGVLFRARETDKSHDWNTVK